MSYWDIDPQDIDPDTGRPYSNYSSPALDTSFHDNEMDIDDAPRRTGPVFRFDIRSRVRRDQIFYLRDAVRMFMRTAPNAHLGEHTPREDLRSAFYIVRGRMDNAGECLQQAVGALWDQAISMEDM